MWVSSVLSITNCSVFLSFGIAVGSAIFGWMYVGATNSTSCEGAISPWFRFIFVPAFTICLLVVNQAHPSQFPVAVLIAGAGYVVNYFSSLHLNTPQVANAVGAFAVGLIGNLYSRLYRGTAYLSVLPAVFVQVPSGLAAQGSLLAGIETATTLGSSSNGTSDSATSDAINVNSLKFGYDQSYFTSVAYFLGFR